MFKNTILVFYKLISLRLKKKQPKNILLVAEYIRSGGTRTYFISLLQFLKKQNYDVTVLMNNHKDDFEIDDLIKSLGYKTLSCSFDFWCIDFEKIHPGLTIKKLINYQLKEMLFWCNILEKNNFSGIIFSVGYPEQYLYAFLLPVTVRYILHTQPVKRADKYKRWILANMLNHRKQIITVSKSSKKTIEMYWLQSKSSKYVNVVYNYYKPKFKNVYAENASGINRILTIGAVEDYKNPFFFIECAKQIIIDKKETAIEFIWAGDGSLLQECRDWVKNYPQIQFVGNKENVEELYATSTIYFQPSLQESHGIAVLGAMYHKLPCIVTDKGGLKESVMDGLTGFVTQIANTNTAIEKINTLLHDEKLSREMGINGFKYYTEKFTEQAWINSMINFI